MIPILAPNPFQHPLSNPQDATEEKAIKFQNLTEALERIVAQKQEIEAQIAEEQETGDTQSGADRALVTDGPPPLKRTITSFQNGASKAQAIGPGIDDKIARIQAKLRALSFDA